MYKEFMGEGYHEQVRMILGADETLCPNKIIDADMNIGAMKMMISGALESKPYLLFQGATEQRVEAIAKAARYYLAAVICLALKSRTSAPPYDTPKYRKDWEKKRKKCADKGNSIMLRMMRMG